MSSHIFVESISICLWAYNYNAMPLKLGQQGIMCMDRAHGHTHLWAVQADLVFSLSLFFSLILPPFLYLYLPPLSLSLSLLLLPRPYYLPIYSVSLSLSPTFSLIVSRFLLQERDWIGWDNRQVCLARRGSHQRWYIQCVNQNIGASCLLLSQWKAPHSLQSSPPPPLLSPLPALSTPLPWPHSPLNKQLETPLHLPSPSSTKQTKFKVFGGFNSLTELNITRAA